MKRIAIITGVMGFGGIESSTVSLFENIDCDGYDVDFVLDSEDSVLNEIIVKKIKDHGGNIVFLNKKRVSRFKKMLSLYKLFKTENYSSVHFHFSFPSHMTSVIVAYLAGVQHILVTSHARGITIKVSLFYTLYQYVSRIIFPLFISKRLAVSEEAGKWMYGFYDFNIFTNGIDFDRFSFNLNKRRHLRETLRIQDENIVIGHIGRFVDEKNHSFIVKFFSKFHEKYADAILLLIGSGELKESILEKCKNEKLPTIHIVHTETPEDYLNAMDLMILPSKYEGFSLVALEAQASGLPVLASNMVPTIVRITDRIRYKSLESPVEEWCLTGEEMIGENRDNFKIDQKFIKQFDIKSVAKILMNLYK